MTQLNPALEQVLQRDSDTLYRLALILAPDQRTAEATLVRLAHPLAELAPDQRTDAHVLELLVAALPAEPRRVRRTPAWALSSEPRSGHASLLVAMAQLPRTQRLVLVLPLLRTTEEPAATLEQRMARRDALLALAPSAGHPEVPARISDSDLPELCQISRAALVVDDPALSANPSLRGHLALCEDCRSVVHAWQEIANQSDDALRSVLRPLRMPAALAERMRAAVAPKHPSSLRTLLTGTWARRIVLPLLVVLTVLALVWPRPNAATSPITQTGAAPTSLRELVAAARTTLYAIPPKGTWTQRYSIRWAFPDDTFAQLNGQVWSDSETGRTRLQLVHEAGGGPYEMMLNDGRSQLWYATTRTYAESLFPGMVNPNQMRVLLELTDAEQRRAVDARLAGGAWALPAEYLRQAELAQLQSWGRQLSGNELIEVIGFQGVSALAGPADAPGGPTDQVTVLLSIRSSDRSLREVRELIGPAGGDQVSRLVWRAFEPEQIERLVDIERAFSLREAWNGTGSFPIEATRGARPELPLVDPQNVASPVVAIEFPASIMLDFPNTPPAGAKSAVVVPQGNQGALALAYAGAGRTLTIIGTNDTRSGRAEFRTDGPVEELLVAKRPTLLRRVAATNYTALLRAIPGDARESLLTVYSTGYTREELLAVLGTLAPLTLETYEAQIELFDRPQGDLDMRRSVLAALKAEPKLEIGQVRYSVATIYTRHRLDQDELVDPYHYPAYGGRPAQLTLERWEGAQGTMTMPIATGDQQLAIETFTQSRDAQGVVFDRSYLGPTETWFYRVPERELSRFGSDGTTIAEPRRTLLRLLVCGGSVVDTPSTTHIVVSETPSRNVDSCIRPMYSAIAPWQATPRWSIGTREYGPALDDLNLQTVTTVVVFDPQRRVRRIDTYAGPSAGGEVLESWELVSDQIVSADALPAELQSMPSPLFFNDYVHFAPQTRPYIFGTRTITEAWALVKTPLLVVPPDQANLEPFAASETPVQWFGATNAVPVESNLSLQGEWVFEQLMRRGLAVQMSVDLINPILGRSESVLLYLGKAEPITAFLRATSVWQSSTPTSVTIGERSIPGWEIGTERGTWVLVEFDGTLLAFPNNTNLRLALARMQIVTP